MNHGPGPSQRQLRVGEQLRHILVETLQRGHFQDERLFHNARNLTISEVRPSPDLKNATAYVSILGGGDIKDLLHALNDSAGYFQKEAGRQLQMKFTPRLRFVEDESFANAEKIENILRQINIPES